MSPITARFNWTGDDLISGRKYVTKLKRSQLILFIAAAVVVAFSFSLQNENFPSANLAVFGILLGAMLIAVPLGKFITAKIIRRQFAKRPDANQEIAWKFSEREITIVTPIAKSEVQWSVFPKVISTPKGFVFMSDNQACGFIPTRAFETPADIENLKTLARQHARQFKELK